MRLTSKIAGRLDRTLSRLLPYGPPFDRLILTLRFLRYHGRLPGGDGYTDVMFRRLVSADTRSDLRRRISDKEEVKAHVAARVGPQHIVPTLALFDRVEDIRVEDLPADCCIKPTHMSGEVVFRRDGAPVDPAQIAPWFQRDYYQISREPNYRGLTPRVMVEPLIFGQEGPSDYKLFCAGGRVRMIQIDHGRFTDHRRMVFDREWRPIPFSVTMPPENADLPAPANLGEMIAVAEALARDFDFIRVDLYSDGQTVLVGELTNVPLAAMARVMPEGSDQAMRELIFG